MKCSCDDWIGGVVCKDVVLMYVIICVVDLRCWCLYVEYCPDGDHVGFQVGFLKQYVCCF